MDLDDHRFTTLLGGYKDLYDPRPAIARFAANGEEENIWGELWNELHHQGDVGDASYAAVILLADVFQSRPPDDWNLFALASVIEVERHRKTNPPVPLWLLDDYRRAWQRLVEMAVASLQAPSTAELVQSALAVVALGNNALKLGAFIIHTDSSELNEILNEQMSWYDLYTDGVEQIVEPERRERLSHQT